jgi:hypothetical protein
MPAADRKYRRYNATAWMTEYQLCCKKLLICPSTKEMLMRKSPYAWLGAIVLLTAVTVSIVLLRPREALAQGQYPIADRIAAKVVAKYQTASCEQLWEQRAAHTPPSMEEQRAIAVLKGDPQMRAAFINQIAPPIANKMFDCGMIP